MGGKKAPDEDEKKDILREQQEEDPAEFARKWGLDYDADEEEDEDGS